MPVLDPAGPLALRLEHLWWFLFWVALGVFLVVVAWLALAVWRRRSDTPRPTHRMAMAVGVATGITVGIIAVYLVISFLTGRGLTDAPGSAISIKLTGHQWWWEVEYQDPVPANQVTTANEIHIPVGVPVKFSLGSSDVIHSFWVPALSGKRDLNPGYTSTLWFQADTPGVYRGQCAEFCGHQHAKMGVVIVAEPATAFENWRTRERQAAAGVTDSAAAHGSRLFTTGTCVMCHSIRGTIAGGTVGPDLTHLASRNSIAAGSLPNTPDNLRDWIRDPQLIKPGVKMPASDLSPAELKDLVTYLETLQ
jgi:cytochrome c oxidase subunit II